MVFGVALLASACAGGKNETLTSPTLNGSGGASLASSLVFSHSPIPVDAIEFVVPIGNLNPPDHTLPTDHAYFYFRLFHPDAPPYEVVAPAGGIVMQVRRERDDTVRVQATGSHVYYLGHIIADASLAAGATLTAGQRVGVTSNLSYGIDLGLSNDRVALGFVNPLRYSADTLHAENPFKYFADGVRASLYAKEQGTGAQPDGRIDFDRAGTLAGNWFLDGMPVAQSSLFESGPRQLAFVRDVNDPSSLRISIGGSLALAGPFATDPEAPTPESVTPSSGPVAYRLRVAVNGGPPRGWLLVELTAAEHLRAEAFPDSSSVPAAFTSQALTYSR